MPLSLSLGTLTSWNPLGPAGPVTGLLCHFINIRSFSIITDYDVLFIAGKVLVIITGSSSSISSSSKGKTAPLQSCSGPERSRNLRFPDFMTTAHDSGKVVSLTHRQPLPPENAPGYSFLLEA